MPYEPIVPEGLHLGNSRNHDDAVVGHLFDDTTNELKGHAAWEWVDEPDDHSLGPDFERPRPLTQEEIEAAAQMAALIVLAILKTVEVAAPVVNRWWNKTAGPALKSAWTRVMRLRSKSSWSKKQDNVERPATIVPEAGAELEILSHNVEMTRAEWEARFRAMVAAGAFKERQQRILARARIVDAADDKRSLTPQQFTQSIRAMLIANPALLDGETAVELVRFLQGPQTTTLPDERRPSGLQE